MWIPSFVVWSCFIIGMLILILSVFFLFNKKVKDTGFLVMFAFVILFCSLYFVIPKLTTHVCIVTQKESEITTKQYYLLGKDEYKFSTGKQEALTIEPSQKVLIVNDTERRLFLHAKSYSAYQTYASGGGPNEIAPQSLQSGGGVDYIGPTNPPPDSIRVKGATSATNYWLTW